MLLLCQKDNINRSRSRKLSWQFSLLDLFAILPLTNPKVRLATRCSLSMTRFNVFCANPEQTGDTQVAPTDEIKIFCFIAYGCAFCDRGDLGRIISSPTILLFIFHHSLFIFTFVGEAISLPRIRINIVLSVTDQTKIYMSLFTIQNQRNPW